jgi:glycosyltransferase involved in cell wall biosynthesis
LATFALKGEIMKVCLILHSCGIYGAERASLELIDGLKSKGVECFAILPCYGSFIRELKKRNVHFKVIPYKWWMSKNWPFWKRIPRLLLNIVMVVLIIRQVKRWGADVIFTNTITIFVGALASKILRLPHIWYIHEFGYEDHGLIYDLGTTISLWLMNKLSTVCIANSYAVAEKYKKFIPSKKLKVIYYAVSITDQFPSLELKEQMNKPADIKCAIVGNVTQGKGQEDAIRAIKELVQKGIKAHLYIVGREDPKYRQYLDYLVAQGNLRDYVTFLGHIQNPVQVMQHVDVVLMCSRMEAFGRVTVEAMKVGKPVIGTKSGGTKELILDGFNGYLYSPGDYKELAQKILWYYKHPEIAKQMGENGKNWATAQFNQERYIREIMALLMQLINQK